MPDRYSSALSGGLSYEDYVNREDPIGKRIHEEALSSQSNNPNAAATGAAAGLGAAAIGGPIAFGAVAAFQIWNGLQQADMIKTNARLAQKISDLNAGYAEYDAYRTNVAGDTAAARYQTNIDQTLSDQRSAFASQNVDVNFGTAKEIQDETRLNGFLNTIDIKNQARAKALGYTREARSIRLNAAMGASSSEMAASSAVTSGYANAVTTGISAYTRK